MLVQRRARRRRLAAGGRHRRRPARGHDADRQGHAERARGDRDLAARHDVRPGPVRLHGEARGRRPTSPTCSTSTADRRDLRAGRRAAQRRASATSWSSCSTGRATRRASTAIRDAGARVRLISDGDVSAALLAASTRSPVDLLWGIGGTPEGVISAAAIKCDRRRARRPAVAARRRRAPGGARRRLRPRPPAHPGRPRPRRRLLLLGDRRDRRRRAAGRALRGAGRRLDRVDRHALALGHRAPHQRAAQPREAALA